MMDDSTPKVGAEPAVSIPSPDRQGASPWDSLNVYEPLPVLETHFWRDRALPLCLFLLTCLTTLLAGSYQEGGRPLRNPADFLLGIPFAATLLLILLVHEMGHYWTSRAYGVPTSLPYFIPGPWFPFGIGTFGAFIRIRAPIMKKAALLDIGAAGPFAGFIVALAAIGVGIPFSEIVTRGETPTVIRLGDPLMFSWMVSLLGKVPPEGSVLILHPMAFAGWIGLFVTSLNLLPIGQLDGGHIAYALLGKKHKGVAIGMVILLFILGYQGWSGWYLWGGMALFLGLTHPPTYDEHLPLDRKHLLRGLASLALFIVTFIPVPIRIGN